MNEIKHTPDDDRADFEEWAKGRWFDGSDEPCHAMDAKDAAWLAWEELSSLINDMAMALELIAADADAGNSRLTSGVRMALDAALIKAGRKEAPVKTGE